MHKLGKHGLFDGKGGPPWAQVAKIITVDSVLLFGRHVACKEIDYGITMLGSSDTTWWSARKLANEFGLINAQLEPMGPVYLAGAIIDGRRYGTITFIDESGWGQNTPTRLRLHQNFPNPFNPVTRIQYEVPYASDVNIKVYNILGQEIATLAQGPHSRGFYAVTFNAFSLPSGIYVYRLQTNSVILTNKMVLTK